MFINTSTGDASNTRKTIIWKRILAPSLLTVCIIVIIFTVKILITCRTVPAAPLPAQVSPCLYHCAISTNKRGHMHVYLVYIYLWQALQALECPFPKLYTQFFICFTSHMFFILTVALSSAPIMAVQPRAREVSSRGSSSVGRARVVNSRGSSSAERGGSPWRRAGHSPPGSSTPASAHTDPASSHKKWEFIYFFK